ncbi:short chain dehydrogenase [Gregarina niphandrodes]|uniref:Short chain dehydrogenase n=1 Tax=Gregarina niphandrodes TaxID=110365 RepID=A0A023B543_GRENI|nr:short chain dehydrogenase [Gregarina niphandrodes]EZG57970.1 short chain dehydrogenase [Gregarina niphandrodes]|eukprot:XP_011130999.1 short chain dehydrogenase [Gregarina niphandrodes]
MDKVAVITGASAGIGAATALRMSQAGWTLVLVARRQDRLEELGLKALLCTFDITNPSAPDQIWNRISEALPGRKVDCLVNNAGLALGTAPVPDCSPEDWQQMVETNILALIKLTLKLTPHMNPGATVINLGSVAGRWPYRGGNVYGATKAFVKQFSENLRCDLQGTGIRVCNVEPGIVDTEFSIVRYKGDLDKAKAVYAEKLSLTADNVAQTIAWVAMLPARVSIPRFEIVPVTQATRGFVF